MNDERLVREIWKELPLRAVVGQRLCRAVGARAWERPRFARFGRFFERCGVPDPWDPGAGTVEIGLGEVGVAQRKQVAPHAAPPGLPGPKAQKAPNVPNAPRAPAAEPKAPVDGKPAPRIGESRRDDTEVLRKKMLEAEKKKVDPARANPFKVNQPLARLPMRPDLGDGGAPPARPAAKPGAAVPGRPASATAAPVRPGPPGPRAASSGSGRPFRMPIDPSRRPSVPDGPEEIEEPQPVVTRPSAKGYDAFGMGGGWDDDDIPSRPPPVEAPPVSYAVGTPGPDAGRPATGAAPQATPPPSVSSAAGSGARPVPAAGGLASGASTSPARPAGVGATSSGSASGGPPSSGTAERPAGPSAAVGTSARPAVPASPPRPAAPVAPPPSGVPARPAAPVPAAKPGAPPPRPGRPAGGGGLDDLFGMGGGGGGDNTRVRLPKRDEADAQKPRRPIVTPDAELGKGGVDRRPPPPKPPSVTPTGGGGKPTPDFDGDGGE